MPTPLPTAFATLTACLIAGQALGNIRELQVHHSTAGDQQRVQAAQLRDGRLVFVYEDQQPDDTRVLIRFLTLPYGGFSDPIPVPLVNPAHHQTDPVVAALSNGEFVVAYTDKHSKAPPQHNVLFQRFQSDGSPVGTPQSPHTSSSGFQSHPRIASLGPNGFVIAFADLRNNDQDIYFRRFTTTGVPSQTNETAVNLLGASPVAQGDQGGHDVAPLPNGGFVVVFEDRNSEHAYGIQFDPKSNPVPLPQSNPAQYLLRVDTDISPQTRSVWAPAVSALPDDSFVVAYNSETLTPPLQRHIRARRFDGSGAGGPEFEAGQYPLRWQDPDVLALPDRTLAFVWQARNQDTSAPPWSVRAYPRGTTGPHPVPGFQVGADSLYSRNHARLAPLDNGGFVVVWESKGQDGDGQGVYARLVAPLEPSHGTLAVFNVGSLAHPFVEIRFDGDPFECYQLQATSDFKTWSGIFAFNGPIAISTPPVSSPTFYRVERKLSPP